MGLKIFWFTQIKDSKCAISVFNIRILPYQIHIQKKILDFVSCVPVCPQLGYLQGKGSSMIQNYWQRSYARKEFPQALARWFAILNLHVEVLQF